MTRIAFASSNPAGPLWRGAETLLRNFVAIGLIWGLLWSPMLIPWALLAELHATASWPILIVLVAFAIWVMGTGSVIILRATLQRFDPQTPTAGAQWAAGLFWGASASVGLVICACCLMLAGGAFSLESDERRTWPLIISLTAVAGAGLLVKTVLFVAFPVAAAEDRGLASLYRGWQLAKRRYIVIVLIVASLQVIELLECFVVDSTVCATNCLLLTVSSILSATVYVDVRQREPGAPQAQARTRADYGLAPALFEAEWREAIREAALALALPLRALLALAYLAFARRGRP